MHKDELIQMHTLLCQIKNYIESRGGSNGGGHDAGAFTEYDDLGVSPLHVHRSKQDHKRAIFVLSKELAEFLSEHEHSGPARVGLRMDQMLQRMERPAGKAQ